MMEKMNKTLKDGFASWIVLGLLALTMFFAYIFVDILSPLQSMLEGTRHWDPVSYGRFAGSEMFLNVFVFFLIFAGVILDKIGVRYTALLSGGVMLLGAFIKYYAVSQSFIGSSAERFMNDFMNLPEAWWNVTPFFKGMPASAKLAAVGFMIFGCGVEMGGVTVSRGIVKWFQGKKLALAMGLEMAIARIGVAVVFFMSPKLANWHGIADVSKPVLFSASLIMIGLFCYVVYFFFDVKLEKQLGENGEEPDEPFKIKDLGLLFGSKTFLIVATLCVLYYSAIFPFQKYATNMLQCNLQITAEDAGQIFLWFPVGAGIITPFLGNYLDKKGKGATMLIFGAILMIACHLIFAFVPLTKFIAFSAIVILGISFSLVPAALWPSVPKLVENKVLGSSYSVIFWIQNIGLYSVPMIIGSVLRSTNKGVSDPLQYNYTIPMLIFSSFGVMAMFLALWLKAIDRQKGYGLDMPNIVK